MVWCVCGCVCSVRFFFFLSEGHRRQRGQPQHSLEDFAGGGTDEANKGKLDAYLANCRDCRHCSPWAVGVERRRTYSSSERVPTNKVDVSKPCPGARPRRKGAGTDARAAAPVSQSAV